MIIVVILSFLFDGFVSTVISPNSLFVPLFSILSLIIIYPYIKRDDYLRYFGICGILGIMYDVAYSNTLFLNIGLFLLAGLFIKLFFNIFSSNLFSNIIATILVIIIYRTITYSILIISGYFSYSFFVLLKGIYSSIIINLIYIIFVYLLTNFISKKFKIKQYN